MDSNDITNKQISDQIEGKTTIKAIFADDIAELIAVYEQDDGIWIKPAFCKAKKMKAVHWMTLALQLDDGIFNTAPKILRTKLTYDEFFDKYYN